MVRFRPVVAALATIVLGATGLSTGASAAPHDPSAAQSHVGAPLTASVPDLGLVPVPAKLTQKTSEPGFTVNRKTVILAAPDAMASAELLAQVMRRSTGYPLPVKPLHPKSAQQQIQQVQQEVQQHVQQPVRKANAIVLESATPQEVPSAAEGYRLESSTHDVRISAVTDHGFFNGMRTLLQLLPGFIHSSQAVRSQWVIPAVDIQDAPRFSHRAIMLDVARSFLTVDEVKSVLDHMADVKMSVLHLHLADDQGWRIQVTNDGRVPGDDIDYTRLTSISGATAMGTHGGQGFPEKGRTGFYTQDDYRELVKYAAERHITVIPEIDLPGHTNAALHAIPQLNTPGSSHAATAENPTAPANGTGSVGYSYLDPNSPVTFTFIKHVLTQLAEITPGQYMHVGGDESHDMTKRYGTAGYTEFLAKVKHIVDETGKKPMGWNEYASVPLEPGDAVQYWWGDTSHTVAAVKDRGAKVVMSRGQSSYLDQKYNAKTPLGLAWACSGTCDVRQYYDWDPGTVVKGIDDSGILGPEAPLWSETVRGVSQAEFLVWPRAIAHAEIGWSPQNRRNVDQFLQRLAHQGVALTAEGANFYDTPQAKWSAEVAGIDAQARADRPATMDVGLIAAPGTVVSADKQQLGPDLKDDADGVSASVLTEGTKAVIDWGDGSTSPATLNLKDPRSSIRRTGMIGVSGNHRYASAGTYQGTITVNSPAAGGSTASAMKVPFTVTVRR
ncbi:family 20 glycosylhydrolase [Devriesea agamarum]|uniref:family 20 glycosylhydrolase n=1 Tax=Devriesea agamarum TaxID=472569 RepID=UPI00071D7B08|nr:family 20 glycosylhydrolase [Devriesea agamarum]